MSRKSIIIVAAIVVFAVLLVLLYFRIRASLDPATKQPSPVPSVELTSPSRGDLVQKLSYSGDILAIQQVNIYSRVNGNIKKLYADIGDHVNNGKLLAEIDKSIYKENVLQTEGLYEQAKATVLNNKANYERNKELFEKGMISKSDLDNSETALSVANAQTESALANYNNAQTQLSYCNITAPFSGYVTKRFLDIGAYVSTGGQTQSSVIFTISNIEELKVMVNVLEKDLPLLDSVREANVRTDAYPDKTFEGKIKRLSDQLDLNTRTMPVEIDLSNRELILKPGMFVNVELILKKSENAMMLPSQCVMKDDKGSFVYRVGADSIAHKINIQPGIKENNNTEIVNGISDSDKIVIAGQDQIRDGVKVKPK